MAESASTSAKAWFSSASSSFKVAVGLEEEAQEQGLLEEWSDALSEATSLSYKQRLIGFGSCVGLGLLCTLLSTLFFFHPVKFGLAYTFGNFLSLGSTGFLVGPCKQLSNMFQRNRAVATVIYFISMFLTLFCALWLQVGILTLLCVIVQMGALAWYCMSYIPFARDMAAKCFGKCFGD